MKKMKQENKNGRETGGFQRSLTGDLNSGFPRKTAELDFQRLFTGFLHEQWRNNRHMKFYAITVNPHRHDQPAIVSHQGMIDLLHVCKTAVSIMYIIEKSPEGKMHAHGILASKDKSKFLKVKRHPLCQFDTPVYIPGNWIPYINKGLPTIVHTLSLVDTRFILPEDRVVHHEQLDINDFFHEENCKRCV